MTEYQKNEVLHASLIVWEYIQLNHENVLYSACTAKHESITFPKPNSAWQTNWKQDIEKAYSPNPRPNVPKRPITIQ